MTDNNISEASARRFRSDRIEALDWLRGLMALSIMLFHLGAFGYLGGPFDASTILGKLGIYGVSIFFVLSGLSMAIGYDRYFSGMSAVLKFMIRRIFRIWPLLWIAIAYVAAIDAYHEHRFSAFLIFANMTTLFGFVKPYAYINMGAWSIGNEMVYYSITPLFMRAYQNKRWIGNTFTLLTVLIGLFYCFFLLKQNASLESQWKTYINPLNNMFLYCSGISLYYNFRVIKRVRWVGFLLTFLVCALFVLYPVAGDQIHVVTGINRIVFSGLSIAMVFLAYTMAPRLPALLAKPMEQLGLATYGVYLLHPIIISILTIIFMRLRIKSEIAFPVLVVILTIAAALLSFRYFELPMVKLGKMLMRSSDDRRSRLIDGPQSILPVQQKQI